jgi:hypothetical protein
MSQTRNFLVIAKQFISQAARGVCVATYREFDDYNHQRMMGLTALYLNGCYHSYFRKDDNYVTQTFNHIFDNTQIKNIVCFLHWTMAIVSSICEKMRPQLTQWVQETQLFYCPKNVDGFRTAITLLISQVYDELATEIQKTTEIKCCGQRAVTYDGQDLYILGEH